MRAAIASFSAILARLSGRGRAGNTARPSFSRPVGVKYKDTGCYAPPDRASCKWWAHLDRAQISDGARTSSFSPLSAVLRSESMVRRRTSSLRGRAGSYAAATPRLAAASAGGKENDEPYRNSSVSRAPPRATHAPVNDTEPSRAALISQPWSSTPHSMSSSTACCGTRTRVTVLPFAIWCWKRRKARAEDAGQRQWARAAERASESMDG